MIKMSVMYPNEQGANFDFDYYRTTHMKLVHEHMDAHGLIKTTVEKGVAGADGSASPYICVGSLYFDSMEDLGNAGKAAGTALRDDIKNFTNLTPVRQFNEILDG